MPESFTTLTPDGPKRMTREELRRTVAALVSGWEVKDSDRVLAIQTLRDVMGSSEAKPRDKANAAKSLHRIDYAKLDAVKVAIAGVVHGIYSLEMEEMAPAVIEGQARLIEDKSKQRQVNDHFRELVESCNTLEELDALERVTARASQSK